MGLDQIQNPGESTVDVRIGVLHTPKEIEVDMGDGIDKDAVQKQIDTMLGDSSKVLWLTDKEGRQVGIPVRSVAYVELGAKSGKPRMGFVS
jgi:hypothetical protein